jgi:glycosyltransferase involved in cell wall biosynthesis
MKRILQINSVVNTGSTGKIAEELGNVFQNHQWESHIAYGRHARSSTSQLYRIGNSIDLAAHLIQTRITDRHGFGSKKATTELISYIKDLKPVVILLHNLHGYYLNIRLFFEYLKSINTPIIWVLHDCWAFTGHCTYFSKIDCQKWQHTCKSCPQTSRYPKSFTDNSRRNFSDKKEIFCGNLNLTIVTPSEWLKKLVNKSFLQIYPVECIHNGINLNTFNVQSVKPKKKEVILGVANSWSGRKGLSDFISLRKILDNNYQIYLIGLSKNQINKLPKGIKGLRRTENINELVSYYNMADVFVNLTYEDNFPTTNIEALACDTPIITYNSGGSPEAVDNKTGIIVDRGNLPEIVRAVEKITKNKEFYTDECRKKAFNHFNKNDRYRDYLQLVETLIDS